MKKLLKKQKQTILKVVCLPIIIPLTIIVALILPLTKKGRTFYKTLYITLKNTFQK